MTAPVHFRVEVLAYTLDGPACGHQARGRLTDDEREVTCPRCLKALGIEAAPLDQLTVCEPDPMRRAA
ncbi:MAG TPA: hypothetical protein VFK15_05205 [Burkholderiales bacterium]|nr:hypothetical protein [Burkholderiales bacterium]